MRIENSQYKVPYHAVQSETVQLLLAGYLIWNDLSWCSLM